MPARTPYPSLHSMGEGALIVAFGNLVALALNKQVFAFYHALRELALPGVTDLVPTYASLLVKFNPLLTAATQIAETVTPLLTADLDNLTPAAKRHTMPVHYGEEDGPDLGELAALHSLTPAEAVRLHTARPYSVYFLGFLPGFAYLGRVPLRIAMPRLPAPRVRVPAGSVGIAGVQTGIYPFASPGGWRIVGRADAAVWNPYASPPALFAPGDTVQLVPSSNVGSPPTPHHPKLEPQRPTFLVRDPGPLTTIQDLGRPGHAHLGLSTGGASDRPAMLRANALVANAANAAVLELTWSGPTLEALRPSTIAIEGADFGCRVDDMPVPPGVGWFVRAGALVEFVQPSPSQRGARAYLAVSGGFNAPVILDSRSTCLPASFGGYMGRPLRSGDVLGVVNPPLAPAHLAGHFWLSPHNVAIEEVTTLRVLRYTGVGSARPSLLHQLTTQQWRITHQSDRIGLRLEPADGPGLSGKAKEVVSFGVVRGAIQLPPSSNPVILNADHQTTGGYPLLAVVIQADWPLLAQLKPDHTVRFAEVTLPEALAALSTQQVTLQAGVAKLGFGLHPQDYTLS